MLVLTCKTDQSITLGDPAGDGEVTVVEIRGNQFRLGIKAPKSVSDHRKEVWLQVQQENEAASKTPASTAGMTLDQIRRMQK